MSVSVKAVKIGDKFFSCAIESDPQAAPFQKRVGYCVGEPTPANQGHPGFDTADDAMESWYQFQADNAVLESDTQKNCAICKAKTTNRIRVHCDDTHANQSAEFVLCNDHLDKQSILTAINPPAVQA